MQNWLAMDGLQFGSSGTQTALTLTTEDGVAVAPDAEAGQMDMFADAE